MFHVNLSIYLFMVSNINDSFGYLFSLMPNELADLGNILKQTGQVNINKLRDALKTNQNKQCLSKVE